MSRLIAAALALGLTAAVALTVVLGDARRGRLATTQPQGTDRYCGQLPPPGYDRPPNTAHTGPYLNTTYGYAVTVPAGLTGYTSAAGAPRGYTIVLSRRPPAVLRVDAAYDVFYDITANGVHLRDRFDVRLFDTLLQESSENVSLAGVAGGRYRMTVRCPLTAQIFLFDSVIAVRGREIYRLDLQSVPQRNSADERLLDEMLRSWRWVPVRH